MNESSAVLDISIPGVTAIIQWIVTDKAKSESTEIEVMTSKTKLLVVLTLLLFSP